MITVEIRIATGSKTDVPTGNNYAKNIASIVNKHRENARVLHNHYGGNVGKLEGYEGRTRYSERKLKKYGREKYIKWANENYDWERIEKTKGKLIPDDKKAKYISGVFDVVTKEVSSRPVSDFIPNASNMSSQFSRSKSIFFKQGKWEEHNEMFGQGSLFTGIVEQLRSIGMATGVMRVGGTNPNAIINKLTSTLGEEGGSNININLINSKVDAITGEAFIPNSQNWKKTENIIKKLTMFPQLGFAGFTALFGDTVSSGLSYNRLGQGYFKGIRTHIHKSLGGFSKKELAKINEHLPMVLQTDPNLIGNRYEGVENSGFADNFSHRYFMATGLSQLTDGARVGHSMEYMKILGKHSNSNWKNLDRELKRDLTTHSIGQKDWDIIRDSVFTDEGKVKLVTPNTLGRISDDVIKAKFKVTTDRDVLIARDRLVGKVTNLIYDFRDSSSITPGIKTHSTLTMGVQQGTWKSLGISLFTQYLAPVVRYGDELSRAFVPMRGEKFDKLNALEKGGYVIASSLVAGWAALTTIEEIGNILNGRDENKYNLFNNDGSFNTGIMLKALVKSGGLGLYGDMVDNFVRNPKNPVDNLLSAPASRPIGSIINLFTTAVSSAVNGNTRGLDKALYDAERNLMPDTWYTRDLSSAATANGLDLLFKGNLKGRLERNRRRYAK
jgi:hypothetical protein